MTTPLVVILMGSESDLTHVEKIVAGLEEFGVESVQRIASAHKTPSALLEILRESEADLRSKVYITVAGRSNALSGIVDASVKAPVIACPPPSPSYGGTDIYSSLRMPSGVAPMVILEPGNAALAAAKILGLFTPEISEKVKNYQETHRQRLYASDRNIRDQQSNEC